LPPRLWTAIGDWRRVSARRQLRLPEQAAGAGVERMEAAIVRAADEHEPGARRDAAAQAGRTGAGDAATRELRCTPERDLPNDIAGGQIDRVELAPGRRLTRQVLIVPEARVRP